MNIVPYDGVVLTCSDRSSNGEDQLGIERPSQQLTHFVAFSAVRQVCMSTSTGVRHTWIGMSLLRRSQKRVQRSAVILQALKYTLTSLLVNLFTAKTSCNKKHAQIICSCHKKTARFSINIMTSTFLPVIYGVSRSESTEARRW